ncbi:MAG TPA: class I SAM-dependent methyltransferase, partial [Chloroflexia bacterium]|nr:class I SAM-dependent methyltransferase [Chloroflexia bacterium]
MRESADAEDVEYLLRDLQVTPARFRVKASAGAEDSIHNEIYKRVVAFVHEHPGAHMNDLRTRVPPLGDWSYSDAREAIVRMVDAGLLEIDGHVPLEELDDRYERVQACDLCASPSEGHPTLFWKFNTPVVRCTTCGLLYANPRWKAEFLFGRYDEAYWASYANSVSATAQDDRKNRKRWQPRLNLLNKARQTNRILDVGCSSGEFLLAAQANGWTAYGVETSPIAAAQAHQKTGAEIYVGTLDTATFPDAWFDVVTLFDVIEHVQSPSDYLKHIARLVRPGGFVALTTPNIYSIAYWLLGRRWSAIGPNDHIYYFSSRTLRHLMAKSGFEICYFNTMAVHHTTWRQWLP